MYHAEDKLYCYPNSNTLKNRLGLQDLGDLAAFEAEMVSARTAVIMNSYDTFEFSFSYLKKLHHFLFQDVYEWAGEIRRVHVSKGETRFAAWEQIEASALDLFNRPLFQFSAASPPPTEMFFDAAAVFFVELNMIHPFREGNGRVQRLFLSLWAQSWGYTLDWNRVPPHEVISALIYGVHNDESLARSVLVACWDVDLLPEL